MIRVVIVDAHPLMCEGKRGMLAKAPYVKVSPPAP
jgi:DNA-binding NarL/FixJ family response regulator